MNPRLPDDTPEKFIKIRELLEVGQPADAVLVFIDAVRNGTCPGCEGRGEQTVQNANPDDDKVEVCDTCKGQKTARAAVRYLKEELARHVHVEDEEDREEARIRKEMEDGPIISHLTRKVRLLEEEIGQARAALFYVMDHPNAAKGMGDDPHYEWVQMHVHVRRALTLMGLA